MVTLTVRVAGTLIRMRTLTLGEDLCVAVSGGDKEHIGAVALAEPRPSLRDREVVSATVSVLAVTGHKEDELARDVARDMAANLNVRVCVTCGIHVDGAGPVKIQEIIEAVGSLTREMIRTLQGKNEPQD
jgi:gallate decarboxylase subunit D